jgi:hypothetical protein
MSTFALTALPAWCQNTILLPDGAHDPQAANDCGETCVAAIVACVHGVPISPGSVRAALGGPGRPGITNGSDLVQALAYYNVAAHLETPGGQELIGRISALAASGQPSICLGTWPTPGKALHWMLTTAGGPMWSYVNPWGGKRSWLSWDDVLALYAGELVVADAQLHYDMRNHAQPW